MTKQSAVLPANQNWLKNEVVLQRLGLTRQRLKYLRQTQILPSRLVNTWPRYPADYIEGLAAVAGTNPSTADLACYLLRTANAPGPVIEEIKACAQVTRARLIKDNGAEAKVIDALLSADWIKPAEALQAVPPEHREFVATILSKWQRMGLIDRFSIMKIWHIRRVWAEALASWSPRPDAVSEETLLAHCRPYLQTIGGAAEQKAMEVHAALHNQLGSGAAANILELSPNMPPRYAKRGLLPGKQPLNNRWQFAETDVKRLKRQLDGLIPINEVAARLGFSLSRTRVLVKTRQIAVVRHAHGLYCQADELARFHARLWHSPIDASITALLYRKHRKRYYPNADLTAKNVARRFNRSKGMILRWAQEGLLPHWEICLGETNILRRRFPTLYIEELLHFTRGRSPTKQDAIVFRQLCLKNIA